MKSQLPGYKKEKDTQDERTDLKALLKKELTFCIKSSFLMHICIIHGRKSRLDPSVK